MALIQLRRGSASAWASENPTLEEGELGLETDTGKTKVGNGSTAWNSLTYNYVTYAQIDTTGASSGQALIHNGTKFVPGGITTTLDTLTDVTAPTPSSGDFLKWNGTAWVNDAIDLGADTAGSFVASLVAGTGVTLTNNSGEGATPTVAVDTSVIQARVSGVSDTEIGYLDGVTSAIQTQINAKAPLASPTFTGTPTLPTGTIATTQTAGDNSTKVATTAFVSTAVANLVDSAPATLNTLDELAAALGDDANFATSVTTSLSLKAPLASPTFTGTVVLPSTTSIGTVSNTEIGYLDGVTSSIQTQINNLILSESAVDGGNAYTIQFNVLGAVDAMRA